MKKAVAALAGVITLAGASAVAACDTAGAHEGLSVKVAWDGGAPSIGESGTTITVLDESGAPLSDAIVRVYNRTPPAEGVPASSQRVRPQLAGDAYRATVDFPTPGRWNLVVRVKTVDGERHRIALDLDVGETALAQLADALRPI